MRGLFLSIIFLSSLSVNALHIADHTCRGFLPKNSMWIPDDKVHAAGIAHNKFDEILDRIQKEFDPDVTRRGGHLKIQRLWSNGEVNAYADRRGANWIIHMYGGMARHPAVTYDGFAMVACHELGHHIGGAPIYDGDWASIEGEADYFAPLKCLRRLFKNDDNRKIVEAMTVDPIAESRCRAQFGSTNEMYVCVRVAMASLALGKVLIEETNLPEPKLDTPDPTIVSTMFEDHPEGQCRVDGMFQAGLCRSNMMDDLDDNDYRVASCTSYQEDGARVRCWFKP